MPLVAAVVPASKSAEVLHTLGIGAYGDDGDEAPASTVPPPSSSSSSSSTTSSLNNAPEEVAAGEEYDAIRPNDYELISLERQKATETERRLRAQRDGTSS